MKMRLLATALMALGATAAFSNPVTALATARKALVDGPSNVLKITEILVNPDGSDDGLEFIEIKNTSNAEVAISDVWLIMIDNEASQDGEVDFILRLNQSGMPSTLAAGEVLVIRDTSGGSVSTLVPSGGTNYDFNFTDALKNSGGGFFLVGGVSGIAYGDLLDSASGGNGILDFAETSGTSDAKQWTATYDHVSFTRGLDADPLSTDKHWDGGSFFPSVGNFDNIKCNKQSTWTPDGFTRLQSSAGGWLTGLIYDVRPKVSNVITFQDGTDPQDGGVREYTWAVASVPGATVGSEPYYVSDNKRVSRGLCDGAQITVKKDAAASILYSH